jgi:phosphopantothenoylcysteine decarboxylase/phosphopantothenate--cysteine ligase
MDEDMWKHPSTHQNLAAIRKFGNGVIPVNNGELASGLVGDGRMAEPEEIISFIQREYFAARPLTGKTALVTAGPTYEPIDPVRFIGNHSSGKMGFAIARELQKQGAQVHLVSGPVQVDFESNGVEITKVKTAKEMLDACERIFDKADITVMSAAVADYSPA